MGRVTENRKGKSIGMVHLYRLRIAKDKSENIVREE